MSETVCRLTSYAAGGVMKTGEFRPPRPQCTRGEMTDDRQVAAAFIQQRLLGDCVRERVLIPS